MFLCEESARHREKFKDERKSYALVRCMAAGTNLRVRCNKNSAIQYEIVVHFVANGTNIICQFFFCLYRPMKPAAPAKIISTQPFKCQMRLTLSKNHDIDDDVDDFIRLKSNGKRSDFSHMEIQCMLSSVLCIFIRSGILLHPQMDKKNYQSLHLELVTKTYMPWLTP